MYKPFHLVSTTSAGAQNLGDVHGGFPTIQITGPRRIEAALMLEAFNDMQEGLEVALAGMIEARDCAAMRGAAAVTKALLQQKIERVQAALDKARGQFE